ncbi:hypothetical protein K402DRAFT_391203 [Aulographum hederae CBS 113979]|uniref:Uncharacterized protein n=1 Tax=Aulographum hederae CBS 113979 TaxID=1176131 RepID=A0A6G1H7V8_9PEZI|nr:hypothetical protein K402DRAFT_391203 [Aulographum hederae CBS 113979]
MSQPALCMAFSPDGLLLAAGGRDELHVWDTESARTPLVATWKAARSDMNPHHANGENGITTTNGNPDVPMRNTEIWKTKIGEYGEDTEELPHSISWEPLSKSFVFAVGRQVCIYATCPQSSPPATALAVHAQLAKVRAVLTDCLSQPSVRDSDFGTALKENLHDNERHFASIGEGPSVEKPKPLLSLAYSPFSLWVEQHVSSPDTTSS